MTRHALGDHVVILDNQDFLHVPMVVLALSPRGASMVKQR
jgi:hypothetical protein